jgi:hypothetical protein
MRKILRETIRTIRKAGGEDVRVERSSIHFKIKGRDESIPLHIGDIATTRHLPSLRSELRRKGLRL